MNLGNIYVDIKGDTKDVRNDLTSLEKKATTQMNKMEKHTNKALANMKKYWKLYAAAAVAGIVLIGKSFVDAAKTSENYQIRLKALLGSAEAGNKVFKDMADYASGVAFEYREIMGAATSLAGVMKGGGEEINKYMPIIADLAAVTGLGIEEVTGQVIRMYSAGAASADMFRERGILAMLGFQAGVKYTAEETRRMLVDSYTAADSKIRGTSKELADTWDGLMSMMSDKWFQFRNLIMDAGVYTALKDALADINIRFEKWIANNRAIISVKIPEYVDKIKSAMEKLWSVISYDPAIIEYGIVGLVIGGKKGAVIMGALGHMKTWVSNLSAALGMASAGLVSFSEVARANFKELEAIVASGDRRLKEMTDRGFRMKINIDSPGKIIDPEVFENLKYLKEQLRLDAETESWREQARVVWALNEATMQLTNSIEEGMAVTSASLDLIKEQNELRLEGIEATAMAEIALGMEVDKGVKKSFDAYKAYEKEKVKIALTAAKEVLSGWSAAFSQLAKGSETAFRMWKAVAIAETIVDTYAAAQAAYKAMAGIPVVGPALGVAAAAAAVAAGMVRVSAIRSQEAAAMYHHGGTAGVSSGLSKSVPTGLFDNAPRLHNGLRSDEYPAILQRGEEVRSVDDVEDDTYGDQPIIQVSLVLDGREITKSVTRRLEMDSTQLNRLRKAIA